MLVSSRTNNFDLIRLLAALQVLILHHFYLFYNDGRDVYPDLEKVLWFFPGVNIFFLISGFLIFASLQKNPLKNFTRNRILRIYPGLICCFIFTVLLLISSGKLTIKEIFSTDFLKWLTAQLTVFQFYNPDIVRDFGFGPPNGALWTISMEIQFYTISAFLWYYFLSLKSLKRQNIILSLILICSILANITINHLDNETLLYKLLNASFAGYFYFFLIGALIWLNQQYLMKLFAGRFIYWLSIYIITILVMQTNGMEFTRYQFNFNHLLMIILLAGFVFSAAFSNKALADNLLKRNDISYGIYLYHMPLLNLFVELDWNKNVLLMLVLMSISCLTGYISWKLIEKPFLLKKKSKDLISSISLKRA